VTRVPVQEGTRAPNQYVDLACDDQPDRIASHIRDAGRCRRGYICYSSPVEITFKIPDEFARQVASEGKDPARVALEAVALEGYRAGQLSESALREMLGFETRMEVHAFLKCHGVYLQYDLSDLEQDVSAAEKLRGKFYEEKASGKPRSG
jgi:hypothetical protein